MYFAFNPPHPATVRRIAEEAEEIRKANPLSQTHVMVLIDGAFDENFFKNSAWARFPRISLYDKTQLRDFGDAGPHLLALRYTDPDLGESLMRLAESCSNTPMWSVIVSAVDLETLAQHLRGFLVAECEDQLQWPIRWADTRVLPNLLTMLGSEQIKALLRPMFSWLFPTRAGDISSWNGPGISSVSTRASIAVPVDQGAFASLVESAEADGIVSALYDTQANLLSSHAPYENYKLVVEQLVCADRFSIHSAPVRQHLASVALILRPGFQDMPQFQHLLQNVQAGADYSSEIEKLPQEFWDNASA